MACLESRVVVVTCAHFHFTCVRYVNPSLNLLIDDSPLPHSLPTSRSPHTLNHATPYHPISPHTTPHHTVLVLVTMAHQDDDAEDMDYTSSSDDDSYTTTESESSEPQHATAGRSLMDMPENVRYMIIELHQANDQLVELLPTAMTKMTTDGYIAPLNTPEETLLCITKDPLTRVCKTIHLEYARSLWAKVANCKIPELLVHVLNFDFSFAISELFTKLSDTARLHYSGPNCQINICMTFTRGFAALPDAGGIDRWLEWRRQEQSAGRHFAVTYEIGVETTQRAAELESLRYFTELYDPSGGDSGGILAAMDIYYSELYKQRPAPMT